MKHYSKKKAFHIQRWQQNKKNLLALVLSTESRKLDLIKIL